jgi:hypothetical protein
MATGFVSALKKNKKEILFSAVFILSSMPFILKVPSINEDHLNAYEQFDPNLSAIGSVTDLLEYCDKLNGSNTSVIDTIKFVECISNVTKQRFKHGLANYSLSDNWIANLSGRVLWSHFTAIVDANDILKHNEGLCSQQTIVFLQALKQKGIQTRSVGLGAEGGPGHFLAEVRYEGGWHIYDVSSEPDWSRLSKPHQSMEYYSQHKDSLFKAYESHMPADLFNAVMVKVDYGETGAFPAKKMRLFHQVTYLITVVLPFLFLGLLMRSIYRKRRKAENLK